jgi:hypothetical protein
LPTTSLPGIPPRSTVSPPRIRVLTCRGAVPNKHIEEALEYARRHGWAVIKRGSGSAHAWGVIRCPGDCAQVAIFSRPRVPENHSRALRRAVDRCPHSQETTTNA